jgi:hypothetical protein
VRKRYFSKNIFADSKTGSLPASFAAKMQPLIPPPVAAFLNEGFIERNRKRREYLHGKNEKGENLAQTEVL